MTDKKKPTDAAKKATTKKTNSLDALAQAAAGKTKTETPILDKLKTDAENGAFYPNELNAMIFQADANGRVSFDDNLANLADLFAASGIFGDKTPAQIAVQILAGRELGFGAVASMFNLEIEPGKIKFAGSQPPFLVLENSLVAHNLMLDTEGQFERIQKRRLEKKRVFRQFDFRDFRLQDSAVFVAVHVVTRVVNIFIKRVFAETVNVQNMIQPARRVPPSVRQHFAVGFCGISDEHSRRSQISRCKPQQFRIVRRSFKRLRSRLDFVV